MKVVITGSIAISDILISQRVVYGLLYCVPDIMSIPLIPLILCSYTAYNLKSEILNIKTVFVKSL